MLTVNGLPPSNNSSGFNEFYTKPKVRASKNHSNNYNLLKNFLHKIPTPQPVHQIIPLVHNTSTLADLPVEEKLDKTSLPTEAKLENVYLPMEVKLENVEKAKGVENINLKPKIANELQIQEEPKQQIPEYKSELKATDNEAKTQITAQVAKVDSKLSTFVQGVNALVKQKFNKPKIAEKRVVKEVKEVKKTLKLNHNFNFDSIALCFNTTENVFQCFLGTICVKSNTKNNILQITSQLKFCVRNNQHQQYATYKFCDQHTFMLPLLNKTRSFAPRNNCYFLEMYCSTKETQVDVEHRTVKENENEQLIQIYLCYQPQIIPSVEKALAEKVILYNLSCVNIVQLFTVLNA